MHFFFAWPHFSLLGDVCQGWCAMLFLMTLETIGRWPLLGAQRFMGLGMQMQHVLLFNGFRAFRRAWTTGPGAAVGGLGGNLDQLRLDCRM